MRFNMVVLCFEVDVQLWGGGLATLSTFDGSNESLELCFLLLLLCNRVAVSHCEGESLVGGDAKKGPRVMNAPQTNI